MASVNVLFLLADDMGAWALGAAGNADVRTPHLDALAERGVLVQNFFCVSPVCSPARASLLTGAIPSAHGVHDWISAGHARSDRIDFLAGQRLVTAEFAEHGYDVGLIGKWHLGASDQPHPEFSHWFALEGGDSSYHCADMFRGEQHETVTGYLTDVFADEAIAYLDARTGERPFFLSVNFTAPHRPWLNQHPLEWEAEYRDCAFESVPTQEPVHAWSTLVNGRPAAADDDQQASRIGYFASISAMDAAIGRILDQLEECGLADTTLVVFTSDNGFNLGHHGIWGKGNGTKPQNMYDTSVKVPLVIAGPGIEPGVRTEALLSAYDLAATLLQMTDNDPAPFEQGPGQSFASALRGDILEERPVVVYDEYGPTRMIRTGEWKYIHRSPDGPHELYHLAVDAEERHNLIDDPLQREWVDHLRAELSGWFSRYAIADADGVGLPVSGDGQHALTAADAFDHAPRERWIPGGLPQPPGRPSPS